MEGNVMGLNLTPYLNTLAAGYEPTKIGAHPRLSPVVVAFLGFNSIKTPRKSLKKTLQLVRKTKFQWFKRVTSLGKVNMRWLYHRKLSCGWLDQQCCFCRSSLMLIGLTTEFDGSN